MPQRQVSTIHSISTLTVSRDRQKPASSIVKPTCIPKTRNAATSVQTVFRGLTMSFPFSCGSAARALSPSKEGLKNAKPTSSRAIAANFPANMSPAYRRHSGSRMRVPRREILCEKDGFEVDGDEDRFRFITALLLTGFEMSGG